MTKDLSLTIATSTIEASLDAGTLNLRKVADQCGLPAYQLSRLFRKELGITAAAYVQQRKLERFKGAVKDGAATTEALYSAGYGAPSRLYEEAHIRLGMTPASYAKGGKGAEILYAIVDSPVDRLLIATTATGLCFLAFGDNDTILETELRAEFPNAASLRLANSALTTLIAKTLAVLEGRWIEAQNIPLDVAGTAFQRRVWTALMEIPIGHVWTYSELAAHLGLERGQRAVARGCATNKVSLLIPCHRVLRNDGHLGGYRWGLSRKEALLNAEACLIPEDERLS